MVLYEIWSVGHKPFETMNNNKVPLLENQYFNTHYLNSYMTGSQYHKFWCPSGPAPRMPSQDIQYHDGLLVRFFFFNMTHNDF